MLESERALRRFGEALEYRVDVEMPMVRGAPGMMKGVVPATRTTTDGDVMVQPRASVGTVID